MTRGVASCHAGSPQGRSCPSSCSAKAAPGSALLELTSGARYSSVPTMWRLWKPPEGLPRPTRLSRSPCATDEVLNKSDLVVAQLGSQVAEAGGYGVPAAKICWTPQVDTASHSCSVPWASAHAATESSPCARMQSICSGIRSSAWTGGCIQASPQAAFQGSAGMGSDSSHVHQMA